MADSNLAGLTPGSLTGSDLLYFLRTPTSDFSVNGTALKAWTDQDAGQVVVNPAVLGASDVQAALQALDASKLADITGENLGDLSDVSAAAPSADDVLTWTGSQWAPAVPSGGGGGEANTGANVGTGAGQVFRDKIGATLNFKTILTNQAAMNVANNANEVELSVDIAGVGDGLMSSADKSKLDGIAASAEVNTNSFERIQVSGQSDVIADNDQDILTLVAGPGVVITTTPASDTVTIAAGAEATDLTDLADVTITTPADTEVLTYNSTSGEWENAPAAGGGASALNDLTDVNTTGEATNDALVKSNGTYTPQEVPVVGSDDELVGQMKIAIVAALPGTPDANTLYFVQGP